VYAVPAPKGVVIVKKSIFQPLHKTQ
jgi:hypothetical protein